MTVPTDEILAMLHQIAPDVDPATIDLATPLTDQLDLDSMDYQNLLAAISTRYEIPIPADAIPGLRSIDDLARYVVTHTAAPRAAAIGAAPERR